MTRRRPHSRTGRERVIIVRGERREVPDTRKLARALIALARAQMEREHAEPAEPTADQPLREEAGE